MNQHARWYDEMKEEDVETEEEEAGTPLSKSPKTTLFTKLPALNTPTSACELCVCVCVCLCNSTELADVVWLHPGLLPLGVPVNFFSFFFFPQREGVAYLWLMAGSRHEGHSS